jgi:hypothetical protein
MQLWTHLPDPDDVRIPDFATRISLTRLLLEVEMEEEAIAVVAQLVQDDDESVEALYLGAWARFLLYEKELARSTSQPQSKPRSEAQTRASDASNAIESRDWFRRCLRLYSSLGYEDARLKQHAVEVTARLDEILGPSVTKGKAGGGEDDGDESDDWEDDDDEEEDRDGAVEVDVETRVSDDSERSDGEDDADDADDADDMDVN